jgi:hypothetical protein
MFIIKTMGIKFGKASMKTAKIYNDKAGGDPIKAKKLFEDDSDGARKANYERAVKMVEEGKKQAGGKWDDDDSSSSSGEAGFSSSS